MKSTSLARRRPDLDKNAGKSVLESQDILMATVPWGNWRSVLVYERRHAGRTWLRLRTFNKHRTKGCWYPSPRFFVVPMEHAENLAAAIQAAAMGESEPEPEWYREFERQYVSTKSYVTANNHLLEVPGSRTTAKIA